MSFQLKNIQDLDPISYDEVDKIIIKYEDARDILAQMKKEFLEE